jgi:hypothetical protein
MNDYVSNGSTAKDTADSTDQSASIGRTEVVAPRVHSAF